MKRLEVTKSRRLPDPKKAGCSRVVFRHQCRGRRAHTSRNDAAFCSDGTGLREQIVVACDPEVRPAYDGAEPLPAREGAERRAIAQPQRVVEVEHKSPGSAAQQEDIPRREQMALKEDQVERPRGAKQPPTRPGEAWNRLDDDLRARLFERVREHPESMPGARAVGILEQGKDPMAVVQLRRDLASSKIRAMLEAWRDQSSEPTLARAFSERPSRSSITLSTAPASAATSSASWTTIPPPP